jgi:hypothetical protein
LRPPQGPLNRTVAALDNSCGSSYHSIPVQPRQQAGFFTHPPVSQFRLVSSEHKAFTINRIQSQTLDGPACNTEGLKVRAIAYWRGGRSPAPGTKKGAEGSLAGEAKVVEACGR